ncbi:MAG: acetylxylan esterase [Bryobacteraceae bacterium]|nr:acetylxylan esterase [Bryobacteraceae bacterium]
MPTRFIVLLLGTSSLWAASPGYTLPDPLKTADGTSVTAEGWRKYRRAQVLALFEKHVYGRSPARPKQMRFKVVEEDREALAGKATRREVDIIVGDRGKPFTFRLTLYLPKSASKPVPVFLLLNHRGTVSSQVGNPFFPVEQIVSRGYGAAGITAGQLAPDNARTYRDGVIGFYDGAAEASPDSWKTIAAWAWGGQRAMDYLQTDKDVDSRRIAVVGHSRGGKAALWCGAQDLRFALTISNNSGESGAALARRRKGESLRQINDAFPHWFAENYKAYNDHEDKLPVDQHELISLMAPRLVYVASAETDAWADPEGEFLSGVHATPVYRLLGVDGLGGSQQPPVEQPIHTGRIGYHIRKGGHGLTGYDWDQFMTFADRHLTRWRLQRAPNL